MTFRCVLMLAVWGAMMAWGCSEGTVDSTTGGSDADSDGDGDTDADTDGDGDTDGDADGDTDGDTDGDADGDADGDTDGDTDTDTDADTDECTTGPCCLAGEFQPDTFLCGSSPVATEYGCESGDCGADAQRRYQYQYCTGTSADCGTDNLQWGDWETIEVCSAGDECSYNSTNAWCTGCTYGCEAGSCIEQDCSSGVCCDTDGFFEADTVSCDTYTEYGCSATTCGAQTRTREVTQYCSGTSALCTGSTVPGGWTPTGTCLSDQICQSSSSDAWCFTCPTGCDTDGCADPECSTGPCCSGGFYLDSSAVCDTYLEYQCASTDCGANAEARTVEQHCSGSSASCTGSLDYGGWSPSATCGADQYCETDTTSAWCTDCPGGCVGDICPGFGTGDTCAEAIPIGGSGTYYGSTDGLTNDYGSSTLTCLGVAATGEDQVWVVDLAAGEMLDVTMTPSGFDGSVYLITNCASPNTSCLDGADELGYGSAEEVSYIASSATTIYIIADGYSGGDGDYQLDVYIGAPPEGDTCASPNVITVSDVYSGDTSDFENDYELPYSGSCLGGSTYSDGPDEVWEVTVPDGYMLDVEMDPDSFWTSALYFVTDCDDEDGTCLAGDYGSTSQFLYYNTSGDDVAGYIIADSSSSSSYGTYDLTVNLEPITAGFDCDYAEPITGSGTYYGDTTTFDNNHELPYSGSCLGGSTYSDGNDEAWEVTIADGQVFSAEMDPDSFWTTAMYLVTDCADENGTCLAGDYGSTSQLTYYNDSGSDIAAYLICDSNSSGSYGTYDLTIDLSSIPDGYSCDYAHLITSSGTYSSDTTDLEDNYQLPYSGSCLGTSTYTDGRDEVWEVQIPAGQKLTAILDPSSGWLSYGRFYVITDCADPDGTCLDGDYGSYLEVSYGPVVSDTTVYLVVDSYSTSYDGPYDLLVTIEVPPPGPTCGEPVVVNVPGDLPYSETGGTTCGMDDDYYLTCLSSYDGGEDTIYEIVVSSATTVTFTMDPGTTSYIGMALDDTCPPALSGCVATDTSSSSTDLTFTESLSVGTYYLMLDTWPSPDCIPSYNLTITE